MKSKKILNALFLLLFIFGSTYAQNKEPSTIYVYRTKKFVAAAVSANIEFNNIGICQLRNNSLLKYKIYSEGRVNIAASALISSSISKASTNINVKPGNTYYVSLELSMTGVTLFIDTQNGELETNKISNKNILSFEEDVASPIIEKPTEQRLATTNEKQVIYIEKPIDEYKYLPVSDVSTNIPINNVQSDLSFALIIGNEDYASYQTDLSKEVNVEFARNDASAFKEYAIKTLGIPERNITFLLDGTYGQISQALSKMNLISKSTNGKATLYFYYAGHGLPDQNNRESYIMPVDVSSSNLQSAINLKDVYSKLTEYPSEKVIVFLDACFTGGGREQGLLSARAVRVRPREDLLKGNLTVFASSSGEQTSLPYREQKHGLFTYFLLKKIQETKGELTLKELSDFLTEKVSLESILINNREQTPRTNISHEIEDKWQDWKLIKK